MIGSHGPVVRGEEVITDILESYHDAIKYVHDQTIRSTELLYELDDIVASAKLPAKLANHPWLTPTYGTVEWSGTDKYTAAEVMWEVVQKHMNFVTYMYKL